MYQNKSFNYNSSIFISEDYTVQFIQGCIVALTFCIRWCHTARPESI